MKILILSILFLQATFALEAELKDGVWTIKREAKAQQNEVAATLEHGDAQQEIFILQASLSAVDVDMAKAQAVVANLAQEQARLRKAMVQQQYAIVRAYKLDHPLPPQLPNAEDRVQLNFSGEFITMDKSLTAARVFEMTYYEYFKSYPFGQESIF